GSFALRVILRSAAVLTLQIVHSPPVLADGWTEVTAAFQKLQIPGRGYRRVTTMAPIVQVADNRGSKSIVKPQSSFHPIGNSGYWTTPKTNLRPNRSGSVSGHGHVRVNSGSKGTSGWTKISF